MVTGAGACWTCRDAGASPVPPCLQTVQVPVYSEQEYQLYLHDDAWTKAETDHLFDLSRRFDLRFVVIHDRYDHQQFKVCAQPPGPAGPPPSCCPFHTPLSVHPPSPRLYPQKRSVEDLKERYYHICAKLANVRAVPGTDLKIPVFDAGHERRRKEQLERLYNRTPEQVSPRSPPRPQPRPPGPLPLRARAAPPLPALHGPPSPCPPSPAQVAEEEYLLQELRKIEARKKEREKRSQDLQKLITAADTTAEQRRTERKAPKKKLPQKKEAEKPVRTLSQPRSGRRAGEHAGPAGGWDPRGSAVTAWSP